MTQKIPTGRVAFYVDKPTGEFRYSVVKVAGRYAKDVAVLELPRGEPDDIYINAVGEMVRVEAGKEDKITQDLSQYTLLRTESAAEAGARELAEEHGFSHFQYPSMVRELFTFPPFPVNSSYGAKEEIRQLLRIEGDVAKIALKSTAKTEAKEAAKKGNVYTETGAWASLAEIKENLAATKPYLPEGTYHYLKSIVDWLEGAEAQVKLEKDLVKAAKPANLVIITDIGRDHDDEVALVIARGLDKLGLLNLKAVVANSSPDDNRARLAKGAMNSLGFAANIPVAVGSNDSPHHIVKPYEFNAEYAANSEAVEADAQTLLKRTFEKARDEGQRLDLLLISGMTDARDFIRDNLELAKQVIGKVTIMGGVLTEGDKVLLNDLGHMMPDRCYNNAIDHHLNDDPNTVHVGPSATELYAMLQKENIPMKIVSRNAAYASSVKPSFYDKIAATGHVVAQRLAKEQKAAVEGLWADILAGNTHAWLDKDWFFKKYSDDPERIKKELEADPSNPWAHVDHVHLYDPITLIAAIVPRIWGVFEPHEVQVGSATHQVIGVSQKLSGVAKPDLLRKALLELAMHGLREMEKTPVTNKLRPIPEHSTDLLYSPFPPDDLVNLANALGHTDIKFVTTASLSAHHAFFHAVLNGIQTFIKLESGTGEAERGAEISALAKQIFDATLPAYKAQLEQRQELFADKVRQATEFCAQDLSGLNPNDYPFRWQKKAIETYAKVAEPKKENTLFWSLRNLEYKHFRDAGRGIVEDYIKQHFADSLVPQKSIKLRKYIHVFGAMGSGKTRLTKEILQQQQNPQDFVLHNADYLKPALFEQAKRDGILPPDFEYKGPEVQNGSSNGLYERTSKGRYIAENYGKGSDIIVNSIVLGDFELAEGTAAGGAVEAYHINISVEDAKKEAATRKRRAGDDDVSWSNPASARSILNLCEGRFSRKDIKVHLYDREAGQAPVQYGTIDAKNKKLYIAGWDGYDKFQKLAKTAYPDAPEKFTQALKEAGFQIQLRGKIPDRAMPKTAGGRGR